MGERERETERSGGTIWGDEGRREERWECREQEQEQVEERGDAAVD